MKRNIVEDNINKFLAEKLFSGIKKIIIEKQKNIFVKGSEYISANSNEKKILLEKNYKNWFNSVSRFYLSYRSIYALVPLVEREIKIREFASKSVIRIKADYVFNDIEFSCVYPTHYDETMNKEIEDCIMYLKDKRYHHIVDRYVLKTDTEKQPHEPLTNAEVKYSAFYLFGFSPKYTSLLLHKMYSAGIITNPETNGWKINDDFAEDMIIYLNQIFSEKDVLQYKREYIDRHVDRFNQECIRPISILKEFHPENISESKNFNSILFREKEFIDSLRLYEFIFNITLSTQMKNSIYDTSKIEIVVGNKILKQQANSIIDGEENWEKLAGKYIKDIVSNSDSQISQELILPEINPGTSLNYLDVYKYSYKSKKPSRYGVGRFITQILEKNNIAINSYQDIIVDEFVQSGSVKLVRNMIIPQEVSVEFILWLKENAPLLIDMEYFYELDEKINDVVNGSISLESLLSELNRIISHGFEKYGYVADDKPSESKIKFFNYVVAKNNLKVSNDVYESVAKMDIIIAKYPEKEPIKIGNCPSCNNLVYQKEFLNKTTGEVLYYFSCEKFSKNGGCDFAIWDSYIYKFFSEKKLELFTVEERAETLKKILSKKRGYLFNALISKAGKPYDAKIFLSSYFDKNIKKKKWKFDFNFVNKRK